MRAITLAICTAVLLGQSGSAHADDPRPAATNPASRLGVTPYQSNKWGVVAVGLRNPTDHDTRILVSTYVDKAKTSQFGREFWVPANSRRTSWQSIYMPKTKSDSDRRIAVDSIVAERKDGEETFLKTATGALAHDGVLTYSGHLSPTAIIVDLPESANEIQPDADSEVAIQAVQACQFRSQHRRATLEMSQSFLPPVTTAWDGVRHVVLIGDRLSDDVTATTALRRWLMRGGRIWVMVDRVKQETVERLLGDGCPYQEVDRVGLTTLQIKTIRHTLGAADSKSSAHEQPVPFARVLVDDATVTHTVDGWPAAFYQEYGQGKIIYTTLGMRAWVRPTTTQDKAHSKSGIRYVPKETLNMLMSEFFSFQPPAVLNPELFDEYLSQQIGYQVVERKTILLVLAAFCIGLLLAGASLIRARRFRLLVWAGPVFAITASGLLVLAGSRSLHSVPNTVATVQLVDVTTESDDVNVTGLLAVYRQEESQEQRAVTGGGVIAPPAAQPGATRRMVWTDIDRWHWENVSVPTGVTRSTIRYSRNITKPIHAVGSFGPDGLSGTLDTGPFQQPGDAVLTGASIHKTAVSIQDDGAFVARPEGTLTRGEFIRGVLLNDEQRRRQSVYRKLLPGDQLHKQIDKPVMFVWTKAIDTGYPVAADEEFRGFALLAIPLRIERTSPGRPVKIPATFLPYRTFRGPAGFESSGQLNNKDGTWLERSKPARTWLRVKIPPEVLPLKLERLTVTLEITGKNQPVKIFEMVDGKPRVLAARDNPVGIQRIEIDGTKSLRITEAGEVTFGIFVGDTASLDDLKPKIFGGEKWNIEFLHVEIAGTTLEARQ